MVNMVNCVASKCCRKRYPDTVSMLQCDNAILKLSNMNAKGFVLVLFFVFIVLFVLGVNMQVNQVRQRQHF